MTGKNVDLVMSCTDIGRSPEVYQRDLLMAEFASQFFQRSFPGGKVFVGSDRASKKSVSNSPSHVGLNFDFKSLPFAMARMNFYRSCCQSDLITGNSLLFTGIDVLSVGPIPLELFTPDLVVSYRWHPTQPYCSDMILVNDRDAGINFFSEVLYRMNWMPKEIAHGAADQLAMAIVLGYLNDAVDYDGGSHKAPRLPGALLVPGDQFLYCPADFFSSKRSTDISGLPVDKADQLEVLLQVLADKYFIHFKGNRKSQLFEFARAFQGCSVIAG